MSALIESATGAQILPRPKVQHPRQTITEWQAMSAVSADLRTNHPAYRDIAARLEVASLTTGETA